HLVADFVERELDFAAGSGLLLELGCRHPVRSRGTPTGRTATDTRVPLWCWLRYLAARFGGPVRKAPDVGREHVQLAFAEHFAEGRHLVGATVVDRIDDRVQAAAMQPQPIGQVGGAERVV